MIAEEKPTDSDAKATDVETKMRMMRERFKALADEELDDGEALVKMPGEESPRVANNMSPSAAAGRRWSALQKVVRSDQSDLHSHGSSSNLHANKTGDAKLDHNALSVKKEEEQRSASALSKWGDAIDQLESLKVKKGESASGKKSSAPERPESAGTERTADSSTNMETENLRLNEYWEHETFIVPKRPVPADIAAILDGSSNESKAAPGSNDLADDLRPASPTFFSMAESFPEESKSLSVTVNTIPDAVVKERKEAVELSLLSEKERTLEIIKRREVDVVWREHIARERIRKLEEDSAARILAEKEKALKITWQKEQVLGQQFRRVREELEAGVRNQEAAIVESYGEMRAHDDSIARRFLTFSKMLPQPLEVRVHLMRAVKTKLPKGVYAIMLTQFDSLGGKPLNWSRVGATGIGQSRPGITKVFRHGGRYFDRVLRVEDSCFALCPPRPQLRPSNALVLELFELAGRHNPTDRVVGWTALPMANEQLHLVDGKVKLPLLRGEHSPHVQHFKHMEHIIARDLADWICNIYLEFRPMSLEELGVTEALLKVPDYLIK